jgi:aminoglycoside phosphotransferase (APT) family kinase protein
MTSQKPITHTPAAEILIDTVLVRRLLAEQHPELAELPIVPFASGWDNEMFRLGSEYLVRLPRRQAAAELVCNEQRWLPELAPRLPIAIPVPVRIGRPSADYPWNWSVIAWMEGEEAINHSLSPNQAAQFGRFLRALHQAAPADAPHNPARGVPLSGRIQNDRARLERLASQTSLITPRIWRLWEEAIAAPIDIAPAWLHGDLHPRNLLVAGDRISAVIDWGDICAGDSANDLNALWVLFDRAETRQIVLEAYGPVSEPTLKRAKGWAVLLGAILLETGRNDYPPFALVGERVLRQLDQEASESTSL